MNRIVYLAGAISSIQRISTYANIDDSVTHWTLNLRDGGNSNLKR